MYDRTSVSQNYHVIKKRIEIFFSLSQSHRFLVKSVRRKSLFVETAADPPIMWTNTISAQHLPTNKEIRSTETEAKQKECVH